MCYSVYCTLLCVAVYLIVHKLCACMLQIPPEKYTGIMLVRKPHCKKTLDNFSGLSQMLALAQLSLDGHRVGLAKKFSVHSQLAFFPICSGFQCVERRQVLAIGMYPCKIILEVVH